MDIQAHLRSTAASVLALGHRRLAILGLAGFLIFAGTGLAGFFLSRPAFDLLYAGLDRQDVTRIGAALRDAEIAFDVSTDGASVLVSAGNASRARMLLAEKGLPHSANAGYELFDKLGSLGLTSFMQDITRVRALEGELARTIQTMGGVRAARVHLVMPDDGSFRRVRQTPSASVVLRLDGPAPPAMARAVRHLVASSVAGMGVEAVTILTTDGQTLAAGNEADLAASGSMLSLERALSDTVGDNVRRTLAPYLGVGNVQVSVSARLNTDRRQTTETTFNPESRVERSVRTVRENQVTQNSSTQPPTSVDRNIPSDKRSGGDGKQSNEENQKREEITNYEVSSKSVATVSGGYAVERLDVAVLVNKASLPEASSPADSERQIAEIRDLAIAAAGLRTDRGDVIKVSLVAFKGAEADTGPSALSLWAPLLVRSAGTAVNALAALGIVALLLFFGARPLLRAAKTPEGLALPAPAPLHATAPTALPATEAAPVLELPGDTPRRAVQRRLETLVARDEAATVALLRQWIRAEAT